MQTEPAAGAGRTRSVKQKSFWPGIRLLEKSSFSLACSGFEPSCAPVLLILAFVVGEVERFALRPCRACEGKMAGIKGEGQKWAFLGLSRMRWAERRNTNI